MQATTLSRRGFMAGVCVAAAGGALIPGNAIADPSPAWSAALSVPHRALPPR